jgi:hypothetical protein
MSYFFDISIADDRKIIDFSFSKIYENVPFFVLMLTKFESDNMTKRNKISIIHYGNQKRRMLFCSPVFDSSILRHSGI